ncbi:hypothetical protein GYMLUDRAFT_382007 [Collybiopsis luxurians FD-317 M1]|nr:hypothetical protein GYMLUDRAFT_382007 [Collybiopsis luxurians FD-317 M1]
MCLPDLPDELLLAIIERIAFIPESPKLSYQDFMQNVYSASPFRRTSPELRGLSVINTRMRRICLPFLFAHICVRGVEDIERLRDHCSLCSMFTKTLKLKNPELPEMGQDNLCQILPNLKQLSYVDSTRWNPSITLLRSLLEHPAISTVLLKGCNSLPHEYSEFNLSKVVLDRAVDRAPGPPGPPDPDHFKGWLNRGMKIAQLLVGEPHQLDENFGFRIFEGLQGVALDLDDCPVSFSWLPAFTAAHPHLTKLWLLDSWLHCCSYPPPFIGHFVEECRRLDLTAIDFHITTIELGRSTSQEWHVTGLSLTISDRHNSLVELLQVIASLFPEMEALTLDFERCKGISHFDNVVDTLHHFSCLRYLYLKYFFLRLKVRHREPRTYLA